VASLRESQAAFAAALRDPAASCAVLPRENFSVYRNNSFHAFHSALALGFPVLRKRVGDDYFRQLTGLYRHGFPSRSGDLHWVGRDFATFLAGHLRGSEYAWLADLARLEWSCEQAGVASLHASVGAEVLARFAPEQLEFLLLTLQPSLQLLASDFPVFSVWRANQGDSASPVDQSAGPQCGLVRQRFDAIEVRRVEPRLFSYLSALAAGAPLGEAISSAGLDQDGLVQALGFVFAENLVCAVTVKGASFAP
jgi:hypothetical protein